MSTPTCWSFALAAALLFSSLANAESVRPSPRPLRIHDTTPISAENPVIAGVPACSIEIPLSEYRTRVETEVPDPASIPTLPLKQRRGYLDQLIDEHLLLWDAVQHKADQTEDFGRRMSESEETILEDLLVHEEIDAKARTPDDYDRLKRRFLDELFDRAEIVVAGDQVAELQRATAELNRLAWECAQHGDFSLQSPIYAKKVTQLLATESDRPFARWNHQIIMIGTVLENFSQLPLMGRPNMQKRDVVESRLKDLLEHALFVAEARRRKLEETGSFREKLDLSRSAALRIWIHDQMSARATAETQKPDYQARLKEWYEQNRDSTYTFTDDEGKKHVRTLEADGEAIKVDYFDALREKITRAYARSLREGRKIEINEALLAK